MAHSYGVSIENLTLGRLKRTSWLQWKKSIVCKPVLINSNIKWRRIRRMFWKLTSSIKS